ncbi:MAG: DUF3604 domain-containing protein [Candidatus Marinimicrobia bacterium]|nr:DUF3604 domain-containing protein [Candidatus Neomarinimicrobiota bacterium]
MPLSTYQQKSIGSAVVVPNTPVMAGAWTEFELVYTAGFFGLDDSGSLKIVWRFACDMAGPQFDDPTAPNYVSIIAGNGATLDYRFDIKNNIRPWDRTLYIKIVRGYFKEGDQLRIRFGDRRGGSPGIRMQTFCEDTFELKVLVDAFATCDYVELPESPTLKIIPGKAVRWRAVLPTQGTVGQPFRLCLKTEDPWGNPAPPAVEAVQLSANLAVTHLPAVVKWAAGQPVLVIENLVVAQAGDLRVQVSDTEGNALACANPMRAVAAAGWNPYWGDLHGQSEETIGTNSIHDYFTFARDRAFLDVCAHQGNDFQITRAFWDTINQTTADFHAPGRFITFPGYEYSAHTDLGGDHNVLFLREGETIHRSSHALIADQSDADTDRYTARELFETLKDRDVFVYAHVGGRYANLRHAVGSGLTPAIEIHSAWGTFEWLLHDAFDLGLRPGIVANSDGHKGRPGASYPGASKFGSYGGLTCFLCASLTRESIFDALRRRRHYATTGTRLWLDVHAEGDGRTARMGEAFSGTGAAVTLKLDVLTPSAIERIDVFNGKDSVATWRPDCPPDSRRIKLLWEGAAYRGRGRETNWDGTATVVGNACLAATPINCWNPERPLTQTDERRISWQYITTGGLAGCELLLKAADAGELAVETPLVRETLPVSAITAEDTVFEAGGLGRRLRLFRVPEENATVSLKHAWNINIRPGRDNPLYVRIRLADGHLAWSSPIYAAP